MSEITDGVRRRRRRSDAERSAAAILDAAVRVMGQRPEASVEEIASAAGVTRQTVYAHYPSRQALLDAVIERITGEVIAAIEAARLDEDTASVALLRWLDTSWRVMERYPLLLHPSVTSAGPEDSYAHHAPILGRLRELIHRGQRSGEFDPSQPADWLIAAIIAVGHAAGDEVAAERMTMAAAATELRTSVLRLCQAPAAES
ncbi:MAG: TetR/AcrR family transcriptional regulator [Micromonosporaceae bacterium]